MRGEVRKDGTAVCPSRASLAREDAQIPPRRHRGDAELLFEGRDCDGTSFAQRLEDQPAPFLRNERLAPSSI